MTNLAYTRIFADESGISHFEELSVELDRPDWAPPETPIQVAAPIEVSLARLSVMPVGFVADWHPAPQRQYSLHLSGELDELAAHEIRCRRCLCLSGLRPAFPAPGDAFQATFDHQTGNPLS